MSDMSNACVVNEAGKFLHFYRLLSLFLLLVINVWIWMSEVDEFESKI